MGRPGELVVEQSLWRIGFEDKESHKCILERFLIALLTGLKVDAFRRTKSRPFIASECP